MKKRLTIKEIQSIQLDILIKIAEFCDQNKIKYFLGCGTLCGAVVKNGFFDWDDDIDILIPRKDYQKFISLFKCDDLKLLDCRIKDYYYPYAKIVDTNTVAYECKNDIKDYGVFVDIFPLDGVPSNFYLNLLKPIKYLMMSQWGCYLDKRNIFVKIIYKLLSILTKIFPKNYFAKILNNICMRYSLDDYSEAGIVVHYRKRNEIVESVIFDKRVKVLFEKYRFYAPREYDKYLRCLYGDYEIADNCENHSHFRAYWK